MSEEQRARAEYRKANKQYLGLTDEQCDTHYDLSKMKIAELPDSLREYCYAQSGIYGTSGRPLMCWIADWLKAGNTVVDPLAGESEADAEAGRLAAIRQLGGLNTR